MNKPIHDNQINRIILKPRFKFEVVGTEDDILKKFKNNLEKGDCVYCGKIVDNHIVIDVPKEKDTFWSPQLQIEIDKNENNKTVVKGILGPKPQVWTFFMFLHFAVAVTFFVFLVMFLTQWNLKQDYNFSLIMLIVLPIVWVVLYFSGQLGKRYGYGQMQELHSFLMKTINKLD